MDETSSCSVGIHRVFIHWNAFKKAAWPWILSKLGGWVGVIIEIYPIQSFFKNVWTCLTKPLINNCSNGVIDSHPLPPIFSRISKNLHIGKKMPEKKRYSKFIARSLVIQIMWENVNIIRMNLDDYSYNNHLHKYFLMLPWIRKHLNNKYRARKDNSKNMPKWNLLVICSLEIFSIIFKYLKTYNL